LAEVRERGLLLDVCQCPFTASSGLFPGSEGILFLQCFVNLDPDDSLHPLVDFVTAVSRQAAISGGYVMPEEDKVENDRDDQTDEREDPNNEGP
jgi:hypothetical protein